MAIRIRPFNGKERARDDLLCWAAKDETRSRLVLPDDARAALQDKVQKLKTEGYTSPNFGEDSCFGADACTGDIYAAVGKRVVDGSLRGVNGTHALALRMLERPFRLDLASSQRHLCCSLLGGQLRLQLRLSPLTLLLHGR